MAVLKNNQELTLADRISADRKPGSFEGGHPANAPIGNIGRFTLLRELGRGAHGVVYLAFDPILRREVALKLLHPRAFVTPQLRRRFQNEGQAIARLNHPNIVSVLEAGELGLINYLVETYCPGKTLQAWLADRTSPVPIPMAARIVFELSAAVNYAHEQGVLHRDIKPSNVMLDSSTFESLRPDVPTSAEATSPEEYSFVPRLLDFGLAKSLQDDPHVTATDGVVGSPVYMSPEQASGDRTRIGRHSDVYSLGTILYELLAGRPPLVGATPLETLDLVKNTDPPSIRFRRPDVPPDLEAICLKCIEKEPLKRYASAAELSVELDLFLHGHPVRARCPGQYEKLCKFVRRQTLLSKLLAILVITFGLALIMIGWQSWNIGGTQGSFSAVTNPATQTSERLMDVLGRRYATDLNHAFFLLNHSETSAMDRNRAAEQAKQILQSHIPASGEPDRRGFEWHYLWKVLNPIEFSPAFPLLREIPAHLKSAYSVAISPDSKRVATAGEDGLSRVWGVENGDLIFTLKGHTNEVNLVQFSPDGKILATASDDRTVRLWNAETGDFQKTLWEHTDTIVGVAFHPTKPQLAASTADGLIKIWDLASQEEIAVIKTHSRARIESLAYSPEGNYLATVGSDFILRLWSVISADSQVAQFSVDYSQSLAFSHDGHLLAAGGLYEAQVFQVASAKFQFSLKVPSKIIRSLCFTADDSALIVVGDDLATNLLDLSTGDQWNPFLAKGVIWGVAASESGQFVATTDADGRLQIWDSSSRMNFHRTRIDVRKHVRMNVAVAGDGARVAVTAGFPIENEVDEYGDVSIWDISDREPKRLLKVEPQSEKREIKGVTFTVDDQSVVYNEYLTNSKSFRFTKLDVESKVETVIAEGLPSTQRNLRFNHDGSVLISLQEQAPMSVRFWDSASGKSRGEIIAQRWENTPFAVSDVLHVIAVPRPDSKKRSNGVVELYRVSDRFRVATCDERAAYPTALIFSSTSNFLIAHCPGHGEENGLYILNGNTGALIRRLSTSSLKPVAGNAISFSYNEQILAVGSPQGIVLMHLESDTVVGLLPFPSTAVRVDDLRFTADGKSIVAVVQTAANESSVFLWSTR